MFIERGFSIKRIWQFSGKYIIILTAWSALVVLIYEIFHLSWLKIPWLPLSLIGTAVAFYLGFKNNSAYDRMWEARKIWGAIVNSSRAWGTCVKNYISNHFADEDYPPEELYELKKKLIYRHIGWLYALRSQLLIPTTWEHSSQGGKQGRRAAYYQRTFGTGLVDDEVTESELSKFLPPDEYEKLIHYKNTATQIIDQQGIDLAVIHRLGLIDSFRHMELQKILYHFYEHQGKAERIKKFPLPRQYGNMSFLFVALFIFLLPFGMVTEFAKLGDWGVLLSIPFTGLVAWVYFMMEMVGDYSENPFSGMGNDIPMLSLCRVIEIDLREMLGETELPEPIKAKNGVLM